MVLTTDKTNLQQPRQTQETKRYTQQTPKTKPNKIKLDLV